VSINEILEFAPFIENVMCSIIPFVNWKKDIVRVRSASYFYTIIKKAIELGEVNYIEDNADIFHYFLIRSFEDDNADVKN